MFSTTLRHYFMHDTFNLDAPDPAIQQRVFRYAARCRCSVEHAQEIALGKRAPTQLNIDVLAAMKAQDAHA